MTQNTVTGSKVKTKPYYTLALHNWLLQSFWILTLIIAGITTFIYGLKMLSGFISVSLLIGGYPISLSHFIYEYVMHKIGRKKRYVHMDSRGELLSVTSDPVYKGTLVHNSAS